MSTQKISSGTFHRVPKDLHTLLQAKKNILEQWNALTPLARNEWICWLTIVKKSTTREEHLITSPGRITGWKEETVLLAWMPSPKTSGTKMVW